MTDNEVDAAADRGGVSTPVPTQAAPSAPPDPAVADPSDPGAGSAGSGGSEGQPTLAERIDFLFRTLRDASGKEHRYKDVVAALARDGGATVSEKYLYLLRTGKRANPTKAHLEAIATFFGVPTTYFFENAPREQLEVEVAVAAAMRDPAVRELALQASGLSARTLQVITEMVTRAREVEGLTGPGASGPGAPDQERP